MGWIAHTVGWKQCLWFAGLIALTLGVVWFHDVHDVKDVAVHQVMVIEWIERGGGLASLDASGRAGTNSLTWPAAMAIEQSHADGIYLGQYCITTLTWFFLTCFPIYLSQSRRPSIVTVGFLAAVPALCGFAGGILGGVASDRLLKAGHPLPLCARRRSWPACSLP